jgi:SGNH domain (fused to AT3 domains)
MLGCVAALALSGAAAARTPATASRCFGAASRDAAHPCRDRRLDHTVKPQPENAPLVPNAYCRPVERDGPDSFLGGVGVCAFGAPAETAALSFALVGDSHAMTWRAALTALTTARGWRGLSITRASCPLTHAALAGDHANRVGCRRWNANVTAWLRRHPEVNLVFVSGRGTTPVLAAHGKSEFATKVAGYRAAWAGLPATVTHIVVLRDNPQIRWGTFDCIHRAVAAHERPGPACALPRASALAPDPAAAAVAQEHSPRVQLLDLTDFMCDRARCYPVVGGALVDKDRTHLATGFSTTLGPYLLRRFTALSAGW